VTTRAASHEVMLDRGTGKQVKDQTLTMHLSELRARIQSGAPGDGQIDAIPRAHIASSGGGGSRWLLAIPSNAYYHYVHYLTGSAPFIPVPEAFDLTALPNKTVTFFVSDTGFGPTVPTTASARC
jgi:hypothetical protein